MGKEEGYPIVKALLIVKAFEIGTLIFIIFASSYFLGIVWYIFVNDFQDWENPWLEDVYNGYQTFYTYEDYKFNGDQYSDASKLVKIWYFGITTLSTIGYGDFHPKSCLEKIVASFIMMLGVSVFSFIMGHFIEILISYKNLNSSSFDHKDLTKWIALLARFNGGRKLDVELINRIEDFFQFYQDHNS